MEVVSFWGDVHSGLGKKIFTLLLGEIPNFAQDKLISTPAQLLAKDFLMSKGATGSSYNHKVTVWVQSIPSGNLIELRYVFVGKTDKRALFTLKGSLEKKWKSVAGLTAQHGGYRPVLTRPDYSRLRKFVGCGRNKQEALATLRLLAALKAGGSYSQISDDELSFFFKNNNWCVRIN